LLNLYLGKQLGPSDLSLLVRDSNGALMDPAVLTFSIFQLNPTTLVLGPNIVPARLNIGSYFINITIPTNWAGGDYQLVWYLQQYSVGDPISNVTEDFSISQVDPLVGGLSSLDAPSVVSADVPPFTSKIANIVMNVRELLSDTNPDRNYHFRPPTPGKVVAGFSSRVGFIWLDTTIIRMLKLTISQLNSWNVKNFYSFTLDNIPDDWAEAAAVGAASKCLQGEAARWAADEFGYSLNGVSIDINKASLYQGLAESYKQEFETWAPLITANRPASVGLRQQRWLLG
jgi:hypothetical protein